MFRIRIRFNSACRIRIANNQPKVKTIENSPKKLTKITKISNLKTKKFLTFTNNTIIFGALKIYFLKFRSDHWSDPYQNESDPKHGLLIMKKTFFGNITSSDIFRYSYGNFSFIIQGPPEYLWDTF